MHNEDMSAAESRLHGRFDLAPSFGAVEHFTDLSAALLAKRRYLKDQGMMYTLIPNMARSIDFLAKAFNRKTFDMHNPQDWNSFFEGHHRTEMKVLSGGYLGSSGFGIPSSCIEQRREIPWHTCVFLAHLSKAISFAEGRLDDLPASKIFSPYIYAINRAE